MVCSVLYFFFASSHPAKKSKNKTSISVNWWRLAHPYKSLGLWLALTFSCLYLYRVVLRYHAGYSDHNLRISLAFVLVMIFFAFRWHRNQTIVEISNYKLSVFKRDLRIYLLETFLLADISRIYIKRHCLFGTRTFECTYRIHIELFDGRIINIVGNFDDKDAALFCLRYMKWAVKDRYRIQFPNFERQKKRPIND